MNNENVTNIYTLKALREKKGWNQQTLASKANIDRSVVSRIERGLQTDLKASVLVALARALETTVDSLLNAPFETNLPLSTTKLINEFDILLLQIGELPTSKQRHLAAIVRAYLSAIPEE